MPHLRQCAFAPERLTAEVMAEAWPLLQKHWREIAHYQDIPLNPDEAVYLAAQEAGFLKLYTARDYQPTALKAAPDIYFSHGQLVGYAVFFVRTNPHYSQSLQAVQDVVFLDESMRGLNGWKFLKYCDRQLEGLGVDVIYHHVKALHDFGKVLNRMGYEEVDKIYARRIRKETNGDHGSDLSPFARRVADRGEPSPAEAEGDRGAAQPGLSEPADAYAAR